MTFKVLILFFSLLCTHTALAESDNAKQTSSERSMTQDVAIVYGVTWAAYPTFQPEIMFGQKGSWVHYRKNFGRTVFDQDQAFWNWMVHPLSGSQLFLYYQFLGYSDRQSFWLTTISSTLFEYTVEVYSEPASFQDLYQTPALGSALGYGLKKASEYLSQQESSVAKIAGRCLNPFSNLKNQSLVLSPITDPTLQRYGAKLSWNF